jgi:hypothetical protein
MELRIRSPALHLKKPPGTRANRVEWWHGVSPVEVSMECGGQLHTVSWADGQLHAVDHDRDDEDGESALVALGAPRRRCTEVIDAWYGLDDSSAARLAVASIEKLMPPVWTAHIRRDRAAPSVALSTASPPSTASLATALRLRNLEDLGADLLMRRAMQGLAQLMASSPTHLRRDGAKAQLDAIRQRMNLGPL